MQAIVANRNKVFLTKEEFKNMKIPNGLNNQLNVIFEQSLQSPYYNPHPHRLRIRQYIMNAVADILIRSTRHDGSIDHQRQVDIMSDSYGIRHAHHQELSTILNLLRHRKKYRKFQEKFEKVAKHYLDTHKMDDFNRFVNEINGGNYHDIKNGNLLTPQEFADFAADNCPLEIRPTTKALVGCAGKGTDLDAIINLLMKNPFLRNYYADEEERLQHILEHILCACENDPYNAQILRKKYPGLRVSERSIMDIINERDLRTSELGAVEFDIFICHPPFEVKQKKSEATENDYRKRGGNSFCWKMLKALRRSRLLASGGYIALLIPMGWREYTEGKDRAAGLYEWMMNGMTPIRIENISSDASTKMFLGDVKIGGFDMYCAINTPSPQGHLTSFLSSLGVEYKFDLTIGSRAMFLPNENFQRVWNITTSTTENQFGRQRVIASCKYDFRRDNLHQYRSHPEGQHRRPILKTLSTKRDHVREYKYTDEVKEGHDYIHDNDMSKIIIQRLGNLHVMADWENEYLLGQSVFAITFRRSERQQMQKALEWLQRPDVKRMFETDLMWSTADPNICWKMFRIMRTNFYDY